MNKALATKVLEQIELHPEEWDQSSWRCSTGMCFAGWAVTLAGHEWVQKIPTEYGHLSSAVIVPENMKDKLPFVYEDERRDESGNFETVLATECHDVARIELGMGRDETYRLFHAENDLPTIRKLLEVIEQGGDVNEVPWPHEEQDDEEEGAEYAVDVF